VTDRAPDLESSLAEIDRRLRELQRELQVVAGRERAGRGGQEAPEASRWEEPAPRPAEPAPPPPEPPPTPGPHAARLVDDTAERVAELGRRLEELQRLGTELEEATRALQDELARGGGGRGATWSGEVVVRAGPFRDIASLGEFERALGRLPGAEDAYVRSFAGDWALLEVRLRGEVDLVDEIRRAVSADVRVVESAPEELEISLGP
jgi:hypothetical protein